MKTMKIKSREGSDLIPQIIIVDGIDQLNEPFSHLFNQKKISEQWKMSKITQVHKKGNKQLTHYIIIRY